MKKLILLFVFSALSFACFGQNAAGKKDSLVRTSADLKTGNSQDVLTSFFQLALKDLNSKNQSFQFQTSGIALKAKFDKTAWIDTSYRKAVFMRNINFGFGAVMDSAHKLKTGTANIKYAILNRRDSNLFAFPFIPYANAWARIVRDADSEFTFSAPPPSHEDIIKVRKFTHPGHQKQTPVDSLPETFKIILQKYINNSPVFKGYALKQFRDTLKNAYDAMVYRMRKAALWTLGADYSFNEALNINTEYLKGLLSKNNKTNLELDLRGDFYDSSKTSTNAERRLLVLGAGFNLAFMNDNNKSWLEFKGSAEYNYLFAGLQKDEEASRFTLNGIFRFRLSNAIWLPLEFKYDPKTANVFGFINMKFNFDGLKE